MGGGGWIFWYQFTIKKCRKVPDVNGLSDVSIGAFTLAGYKFGFWSRYEISVHRDFEIFTSVYIKISLIIAISIALQIAIHLAIIWELVRLFGNKRDYLHRGGCVNARANNLGIFYPIIPSEHIKTRAMLDIRHAQFGDQNHPARRSARYFRLI